MIFTFVKKLINIPILNRFIGGSIGGALVGCSIGTGSLKNEINELKFNNYREYHDLPYHGSKVGAVVGGILCGFYPIVIPYMAYKIGKNYELTKKEIQIISQDMDSSHVYELIKLNARIILEQVNEK